MFLSRTGSRNQFDAARNSKMAGVNFAELSGVTVTGERKVTSSDNAEHHANRVEPAAVQNILHQTFRLLRERRFFDKHRFRGYYYGLIVDGTLQEKCREGLKKEVRRVVAKDNLAMYYRRVCCCQTVTVCHWHMFLKT